MRRDLVEAVLAAASPALFEDVYYTHAPAGPVLVKAAIFGVEIVDATFEVFGRDLRDVTHTTRALKAKFPSLAKGDVIDDGAQYQVLDWRAPPGGDGRFEIEISLKKL